jgi:CDP-diglyceride synthetase
VTRPEDESRVLGVRFGANPNSSSLGVDVTFLLFGAAFASAVALVLGVFLRAPGSRATQVGDAAADGRHPPPEGGSST